MSLYSLPKEYKIASFDYDILVVRQSTYITLIMNSNDYEKIDEDDIVGNLMKYIQFERGEVYQMDRAEMPLIYAAKANPIDKFKTLKVLKEF